MIEANPVEDLDDGLKRIGKMAEHAEGCLHQLREQVDVGDTLIQIGTRLCPKH